MLIVENSKFNSNNKKISLKIFLVETPFPPHYTTSPMNINNYARVRGMGAGSPKLNFIIVRLEYIFDTVPRLSSVLEACTPENLFLSGAI